MSAQLWLFVFTVCLIPVGVWAGYVRGFNAGFRSQPTQRLREGETDLIAEVEEDGQWRLVRVVKAPPWEIETQRTVDELSAELAKTFIRFRISQRYTTSRRFVIQTP